MTSTSLSLGTVAAFALATACGTAAPPPPADSFAAAMDTSNAAARLGAERDESAARRLRLAREEIDDATVLVRHGENAGASRALARATADAELALELAREDVARTRESDARAALIEAREGK